MIVGIIIGILIAVVVVLLYDKYKHKVKPIKLSEEEERKNREKNEHYDNMLNYNATKAYGGTHG